MPVTCTIIQHVCYTTHMIAPYTYSYKHIIIHVHPFHLCIYGAQIIPMTQIIFATLMHTYTGTHICMPHISHSSNHFSNKHPDK